MRLLSRKPTEAIRLTTRLKLFEPTEAIRNAEERRKASFNALFGERVRTARNNAYIGVTNPFTPSLRCFFIWLKSLGTESYKKQKRRRYSRDEIDGADYEARTRYLHLGKVALYRMS